MVFFLGRLTPEIRLTQLDRASPAVAFAALGKVDDQTGRGKGFIWLAPDSGPDRYQGPTGLEKFWGPDAHVQDVLLHELGHVFGLPHLKAPSVMSEDFPAQVVASNSLRGLIKEAESRALPSPLWELLYNRWTDLGLRLCGALLVPESAEALLGLPAGMEGYGCLKRGDGAQEPSDVLRFDVETPAHSALKSFAING